VASPPSSFVIARLACTALQRIAMPRSCAIAAWGLPAPMGAGAEAPAPAHAPRRRKETGTSHRPPARRRAIAPRTSGKWPVPDSFFHERKQPLHMERKRPSPGLILYPTSAGLHHAAHIVKHRVARVKSRCGTLGQPPSEPREHESAAATTEGQ
jgi:hypothetical protein